MGLSPWPTDGVYPQGFFYLCAYHISLPLRIPGCQLRASPLLLHLISIISVLVILSCCYYKIPDQSIPFVDTVHHGREDTETRQITLNLPQPCQQTEWWVLCSAPYLFFYSVPQPMECHYLQLHLFLSSLLTLFRQSLMSVPRYLFPWYEYKSIKLVTSINHHNAFNLD